VKRDHAILIVNMKRVDAVTTPSWAVPAQPDQVLGEAKVIHHGQIVSSI